MARIRRIPVNVYTQAITQHQMHKTLDMKVQFTYFRDVCI